MQLQNKIQWLSDHFVQVLDRAEHCKSRVASRVASISVFELLYNHALDLGRQAAGKELLGQLAEGLAQYSQAKLVVPLPISLFMAVCNVCAKCL
jgi:hypothetical protein